MPTPKKTNSKTVAKEVPASKKKTCGKSDCKTAVDLEAPAKKKCCRKKASEPEKAAKPAKEAAAAAAEMEKKPAPKTARKAPVKKTAPAPVAPVPAPAKNELTDEQAEAIANWPPTPNGSLLCRCSASICWTCATGLWTT